LKKRSIAGLLPSILIAPAPLFSISDLTAGR